MLALGAPGGSPPGGRRDATPTRAWLNVRVSPSRSSAGVRGGERPRRFHYLCPGPALDANLLTSDYQDPLPDSAGHARTGRLASADTSRRYVLVPDVSGCFR
jgi:hypothetical protein